LARINNFNSNNSTSEKITGCSLVPNQGGNPDVVIVGVSDTTDKRSIAGPYVEVFCVFASDTAYAVSRH
jgi:hypothetical protein